MTLIEKTVFLKSTNLFASVPTEALAQLAARTQEVHAEAGEVLFREGEEDRGTFIVVDGLVELRKGDAAVRPLRSGSAHGEFFLEADVGHQYTGVAREESNLLNIQRDDVIEVMLDVPDFGLALSRAQAPRRCRPAVDPRRDPPGAVADLQAGSRSFREPTARGSPPRTGAYPTSRA
jgi:CRP-like cAMP-binding protein